MFVTPGASRKIPEIFGRHVCSIWILMRRHDYPGHREVNPLCNSRRCHQNLYVLVFKQPLHECLCFIRQTGVMDTHAVFQKLTKRETGAKFLFKIALNKPYIVMKSSSSVIRMFEFSGKARCLTPSPGKNDDRTT